MDKLQMSFDAMLRSIPTTFHRYMFDRINWNNRLLGLVGPRGVGKTTLMLQYAKEKLNRNTTLFVNADDLYFSAHHLVELADEFVKRGGTHLIIDEIHKYKDWSREVKNIYDQIPGLQVIYTGSSILDLEKGGADLSRRKVEFPYKEARPLKLFNDYLSTGYYPFFQDTEYLLRLRSVINQMVESDIPIFAEMTVASAVKLKKLLYVLAQSVPFKPNYTKLARDLDISRNVLPDYMSYLEKAGLVNLLREKAQGLKLLEKVENIYLNNTNLAYALSEQVPDIGSVRETVFLSWMRVVCFVTSSAISDFEIDGRTFEIGGKNKTRQQIKQAADGYVVKDDIEYAFRNMIPLWMFGFIY